MKRWGVIVLVAVVSFVSGGWLLQRATDDGARVFRQARLFDDVLSYVNSYYVDSLGVSELYLRATEGMLDQLHDPYSVLLTGEDYQALAEQTSGNYAGLGIQIDVRDGWITVVAPLPDTPAERAGIQTGDQIVQVDGMPTQGWNSEEAVKVLRGEAGSKVTITVRRTGVAEPIPFTLERARIHLRSVQAGTLFEGGVGYIPLNPVSESSAEELAREVIEMRKRGMRSLVLDLRLNPGGLLDQGVKVADLFLEPKQEIVATRGRGRGADRQFFDEAPQRWRDMPIVVLVNEGTASAAEIIAGALQDHDRALILGAPTFGKGLVQTLFPLSEGVALKLTTARWFTPSGRTIQRADSLGDSAAVALLDSVPHGVAATSDSALQSRPVFRTDAGRKVLGGGGIVPDVIVRPDTLSAAERAFADAIGDKVADYRDVLTGYALALKEGGAIKSERFAVTDAMLDQVYQRLRQRGVEMTPEVYAGARDLVGDQLAYETARYVFGRPAEFRRRAADDETIQLALDLARRAKTPVQLFRLADSTGLAAAR